MDIELSRSPGRLLVGAVVGAIAGIVAAFAAGAAVLEVMGERAPGEWVFGSALVAMAVVTALVLRAVSGPARPTRPALSVGEVPEPEALRALLRDAQRRSGSSWHVFALASAIAFVACERSAVGIAGALALAGVLLVHELGHFIAMKVFGYVDVRVFFVPGFGAATSGRNPYARAWQEAAVLFAGPVPGLVVGGLLLAFGGSTVATAVGKLFVLVNGLNLLPVGSLDGGRLLRLALFSKRPAAEHHLLVVTALLVWAYGAFTRDYVLVLVGFATLAQRKLVLAAGDLAANRKVPMKLSRAKDDYLRALYIRARSIDRTTHRSERRTAALMLAIHERARRARVAASEAAGILAAYLAAACAAVALAIRVFG